MKVLILDDRTWALAQKKIREELSCAKLQVDLMNAWNRRERSVGSSVRWHSEAHLRKRHWEALRLAKLLIQ